jgi:predicted membrane channel-forming protein YqfA (hemolysin III family)
VDKVSHATSLQSEVQVPTDLLAGLLMERASTRSAPDRLPLKIYVVMAVTTLLTFATLTTGYQLLFSHQLFA